MQRKSKERRIDFTKEEMASLSNVSETSFDERLRKVESKYGFGKNAFKREGQRYNFFPPEYAPLLALLVKNQGNDPTMSRKPSERNSDDVKQFNENVIKDVKELPEIFELIIESKPWYKNAESIVEWTDLLVEEMTQIIYNLTSMEDDDLGAAMRYLCCSLDEMNYNLYRNQTLKNRFAQASMKQQDEIYSHIWEELSNMTEDERKVKFSDCPDLEIIYTLKESSKEIKRCDRSNLSVDKGVSEIIKAFMDLVRSDEIKDGDVDLKEYMSDAELNHLRMFMGFDITEEHERNLYYSKHAEKWLGYFQNIVSTPGQLSFECQAGRKWEKIRSQIDSGTFEERYKEEIERKKAQLKSDIDMYEMMIKLPKEEQLKMAQDYKKHYDIKRNGQEEMTADVKRFVGQVLMRFLE